MEEVKTVEGDDDVTLIDSDSRINLVIDMKGLTLPDVDEEFNPNVKVRITR